MELTPTERIKLNTAIVNAAKTGQPLSGELQSLYNRAAQFETTKKQRSVADLQKEFVQRYFSGGEGFDVQPITLHDAAHQFANIQPSRRGELQQQIVDVYGVQNLHKRGMTGFVNAAMPDFLSGKNPEDINPYLFDQPITIPDEVSEGLANLSEYLERESYGPGEYPSRPNDPGKFLVPKITEKEIQELAKRGKEFYSQIGNEARKKINANQIFVPPGNVVFPFITDAESGQQVKILASPEAAAIHKNPEKIQIKGGYDKPNALPYGPITQFMNPPLELRGLEKPDGRWDLYNKTKNDDYIPDPGDTPYETKRFFAPAKETFYGKSYPDFEKILAPTALNRARLTNLIGTATGAGADVAGSVPLFDPGFRQAVEQGNVKEAAKRVATDYAVGAATAPVIGLGAGALNQVSPVAARAVTGALGAARLANPIAVASQLGGSSPITPRVAAAEAAQLKEKIKLAQAARARGSRWKFPTPFGTLAIPELGFSETGGFFFP